MKKSMQAILLGTLCMQAAVPSLPILAGEERLLVSDGREVAQVTGRHEGIPQFYTIDYAPEIVQPDAKGMYRLYNPNSGEHFYTQDTDERDHLIEVGWNSEGLGWFAPASSQRPVYRLYNANAGDHHYTMNVEEKDALIKLGWKDEGIGWYSETDQGSPLYRSYNPNAQAGSHNYTTSLGEYQSLEKAGWKSENIGWYGVSVNTPSADVISELETSLNAYRQDLCAAAESDLKHGDLYARGLQMSLLLKSLESILPNRRFAFQDGKLIGCSEVGVEAVCVPKVDSDKPVFVLTPSKRQILLASRIEEYSLAGDAVFFSGGSSPSLFTCAAGTASNGGRLNGKTCRFERYYTGYLWQNELSSGNAVNNTMDGEIRLRTEDVKPQADRPKNYLWSMQVKNGTAEAQKVDDYYLVYTSPTLSVYYDFKPENLKFWYD